MTLTREHGIWAVAAAVLIAFAVWVARNTEWVDEEVRDPPPPALQRDPELRLKQVLTKLGAKVSAPLNLADLPPPGATLLLSSWNWNLFKEREAALQRWVEAGGALVVPHFGYARDGFGWVPITARREANPPAHGAAAPGADTDAKTDDDADDSDEHDEGDDQSDDVSEVRPPARPRFGRAPSQPNCPGVNEPAEVTPAFSFARGYKTCMYLGSALQTRIAPTWALDGPHGHVIVRVPVGRGSVTASGVSLPFDNDDLLEHDNALIAAAVLRVRPGSEIWIVRDEARPPLLAFLWENGAPAVLLGCAALAFALWRGARRFGPRMAALPLARRSMAEQIRGTAAFVAQHGSPALHAAQLRALHDAAAPRIRGFDSMIVGERAQAIAALAGMDARTLAQAMNPALNATPTRHPAGALVLLETARRRLLNAARAPHNSPESR